MSRFHMTQADLAKLKQMLSEDGIAVTESVEAAAIAAANRRLVNEQRRKIWQAERRGRFA